MLELTFSRPRVFTPQPAYTFLVHSLERGGESKWFSAPSAAVRRLAPLPSPSPSPTPHARSSAADAGAAAAAAGDAGAAVAPAPVVGGALPMEADGVGAAQGGAAGAAAAGAMAAGVVTTSVGAVATDAAASGASAAAAADGALTLVGGGVGSATVAAVLRADQGEGEAAGAAGRKAAEVEEEAAAEEAEELFCLCQRPYDAKCVLRSAPQRCAPLYAASRLSLSHPKREGGTAQLHR